MNDEIKTVSLAESVFKRLESDILSGKYAIGEIITELSLTRELSVSRTPVREAIRRLVQENLVEETPKGHVVAGVSYADICDIYDIRIKIEGEATARFTKVATEEQLHRMREVLELQEFYTQRAEADKIKALDSEFHEIIYSGCGSKMYGYILSSLHRKVQNSRRHSVSDTERAQCAAKEHRELFSAIESRNAERAQELAVLHIKNAKDNIMKKIAEE